MIASGLYVHVPFCRSRCGYCAFCSTTRVDDTDRWLAALALEVESAGGQPDIFDTLYIGGGTPSFLALEQLESLFRTLFDNFRFDPHAEITLEANPADLDHDTAVLLAGLGVNRVSLGAQSFDDNVLAFLGRRHRTADIGRSCDLLRQAGIGKLNLDLISAIPGQSPESWRETMRRAVALEPEHLSCYQLTVEEGTPLVERVERGDVILVDEDSAAGMFLAGSAFLQQAGFEHYEVSNFARGRHNRARHNMKYWAHVPYLGLGPSAHSFDGRFRWWNTDDLDRYRALLESEESAEEGRELLTPEQLEMERVALSLRLADGMEPGGLLSDPDAAAMLDHCIELRLVTMDNGRIKPTREGMLMADGLARELCSL
jgi:oxygen-independent coproporphyrinogen-3 oxidase